MLVITVALFVLMSSNVCLGQSIGDAHFDSWYLSDLCNSATTNASFLELSNSGPNSGGIFALSYNSPYYKPGMNCTIQLEAPSSYKILMSFSQVETRSPSLDTITIQVEGTKRAINESNVECPKENCANYQFAGKRIELNFSSAPRGTVEPTLVGFNSIITAFAETNGNNRCPGGTSQFRCQNLRCIWQGFYCNGQNNCGDSSDEPSHCPTSSTWGILVIVFGAVCFCIFVPVFCFLILWGGRNRRNTTTSKYQPILNDSGSINTDELPILTESDFLFGEASVDHFMKRRPHSMSFTYGSNSSTAVQIHNPSKNSKDHEPLSKSFEKAESSLPC